MDLLGRFNTDLIGCHQEIRQEPLGHGASNALQITRAQNMNT